MQRAAKGAVAAIGRRHVKRFSRPFGVSQLSLIDGPSPPPAELTPSEDCSYASLGPGSQPAFVTHR